jgi:hypothetical protein
VKVHFTSDAQAKLDRLAIDTGRPPDELLQDPFLGYFEELTETRRMLDSRYAISRTAGSSLSAAMR